MPTGHIHQPETAQIGTRAHTQHEHHCDCYNPLHIQSNKVNVKTSPKVNHHYDYFAFATIGGGGGGKKKIRKVPQSAYRIITVVNVSHVFWLEQNKTHPLRLEKQDKEGTQLGVEATLIRERFKPILRAHTLWYCTQKKNRARKTEANRIERCQAKPSQVKPSQVKPSQVKPDSTGFPVRITACTHYLNLYESFYRSTVRTTNCSPSGLTRQVVSESPLLFFVFSKIERQPQGILNAYSTFSSYRCYFFFFFSTPSSA